MMKFKLLEIVILTLLFYGRISNSNQITDDDLIVTLQQGELRGIREKSLKGREFASFLGIPFAEPPLGKLRFQDPKPPKPWDGLLEANEYPEFCLQYSLLAILSNENLRPIGQEDCLYLNVHTPKVSNGKLPVMVFIYGGGFMRGGAFEYPPYVLLEEDIIYVTLQYRVTAFGFLSTGDSTMAGNYGLKDLVMGLRWIKENIANFGGDKDSVTIFGESAGGSATHTLMLSPWAQGLFHRVISQSGTALCPWSINRRHQQNARAYGEAVGCSLDQGSQLYLECLQDLDGIGLLNATLKMYSWGASPLTMLPNIDGEFLPDEPALLIQQIRYNKVDFLSGITRDDGALLTLSFSKDETAMQDLSDFIDKRKEDIFYLFGEQSAEITSAILQFYLGTESPSRKLFPEMNQMFSDRYFMQCFDLATALHSRDNDIDVYRYELDHRGQFSLADAFKLEEAKNWVAHVDDLFYLFGGGGLIFKRPMVDEKDLKIRHFMTKLWTNFATYGNPTPDESLGFRWDPSTQSSFKHLSISLDPSMKSYSRKKSFEFWMSLDLVENDLYSNEFFGSILVEESHKDEL